MSLFALHGMPHIKRPAGRIVRRNKNQPKIHQWFSIIPRQHRPLQTVGHHSGTTPPATSAPRIAALVDSLRSARDNRAMRFRHSRPTFSVS